MSLITDIDQTFLFNDIEHFQLSLMLLQGGLGFNNLYRSNHILVFPNEKRLKAAKSKLAGLGSNLIHYPQIDYWGDHRNLVASIEMQNRMFTLVALSKHKPCIIFTTASALLQKTLSAELLARYKVTLSAKDNWDGEELIEILEMLGYVNATIVEYYGTFCAKKDIFDIFIPGLSYPVRIRIKDQVIDSMRMFSPLDQSSISSSFNHVTIYPACDVIISNQRVSLCAQKLHDYMLSTDQDLDNIQSMMEGLTNRKSFVGLYKFSPLFRQACEHQQHTLLDHVRYHDRIKNLEKEKEKEKDQEDKDKSQLEFSSNTKIWLVDDLSKLNDSIELTKDHLEQSYQWELKNSQPTLTSKWHYHWKLKLNDIIDKSNVFQLTFDQDFTKKAQSSCSQTIEQAKNVVFFSKYISSSYYTSLRAKSSLDITEDLWSMITAFGSKHLSQITESSKSLLQIVEHHHNTEQSLDSLNRIIIVCEDMLSLNKVLDLLQQRALNYQIIDNPFEFGAIQQTDCFILVCNYCNIEKDYFVHRYKLHYLPDRWLIKGKVRDKKAFSQSSKDNDQKLKDYLHSISQIEIGDLVVHRDHGVGRYLGLFELTVLGQQSEFIRLEYKKKDKVYIPIDQIQLLQKHSQSKNKSSINIDQQDPSQLPQDQNTYSEVNLDSLSKNSTWQKKKLKAKNAVKDLAESILKVHSQRALSKIKPFLPPCSIYQTFLEDFSHLETKDQLSFCEDIEDDLVSGKIIDRLLIGDVGFGKTEMAMRVAMRVVLQGYQVMVLCPTTVLCFQHHQTFENRMNSYSVKVEAVNRFVSSKIENQIVIEFTQGKIDILIGTHKLLNSKFQPKKLGLIVIDEEQRFGVMHKEKIKGLRAQAGVLALSATPIPRTLHMSMLGLRDISLLTTPPAGRLAIKNHILNWDDSQIRNAILNEVRRGGQVFFVHNRVEDIERIKEKLVKLVPECEIKVAHGRMTEGSLERILRDFVTNRFNILLCTTIMESGVDMPNVNTIIINNAHNFGLSQLYQLRGRVGRAGVQAYAFLITKNLSVLSELSRKRLQGIMNFQALSSGFSISSYDMDIRGVGDLLGDEQSGHVASIGLEMYTNLLDQAIKQAKGESIDEPGNCEVKVIERYSLPKSYINHERQRISLYKKLFSYKNSDQIWKWASDLQDRYGSMPQEGENLTTIALIKLSLAQLAAKSLKESPQGKFHLYIPKLPENRIDAVMNCLDKSPSLYQLVDPQNLTIDLTKSKNDKKLSLLYEKIYDLTS